MIFGLCPVIQRTLNKRGPAKNPPMMKLVTFELYKEGVFFSKLNCLNALPFIKKPYIVCVKRLSV